MNIITNNLDAFIFLTCSLMAMASGYIGHSIANEKSSREIITLLRENEELREVITKDRYVSRHSHSGHPAGLRLVRE